MTEILKDKINDHLSERSNDTNDTLKRFLVEKVIDDSTDENKKLKEEIMSDIDIDEKLESALNKDHLTNFLTKMKDELVALGYTEAYKKRGKALTFGVQSALSIMGFDIGAKEIDGYYGRSTANAVRQFQAWKMQPTDIDGSAGINTINAILAAGLDTKITEEEKANLDITSSNMVDKEGDEAHKEEDKDEDIDFYTTHTEFTEQEIGGVMNKVYTVEKFEDIPTVINPHTVIDFGSYRIFSNGRVIEYSADRKTTVRKGDRSEIGEDGKWKEVVSTNDKPKENITASNMTFDQLQVNLDAIWSKYFTFDKQWQKDFISAKHLDQGISIEKKADGMLIRSKGSSYFLLTLDKSEYETADGKINTKEVISLVKKNIVEQMENAHYRTMLKDKIDSKYANWNQIFTKEELADTTSEQGMKIQEFIASFPKNGATVDIIKKAGQYMINRANGKLYFDFTFQTKSKALWNTNNNVISIASITDEKGEFNQAKWNKEVRNIIFQKKLTHPYFTKYEKVEI